MKNHADTIWGGVLSALTFLVGHFDAILGAAVGLVSLAVMLLRLRREWKHRNDPPENSTEI